VRGIRILVWAIAVLAATLPLEQATAAHRSWRNHARHYHHHHRVARVELAPADYSNCRWGWWQSLRYGHVQPYWGARCR
jgi:hypothetical protein